jgi:preprotein translocase subunit SecG
MGILSVFLLVIFIIACILLVLMVIIQDSDSDSLGGIFAGGSGSAFGSRSTNVVVRFTYALGAIFFVCAFSLALLNKSSVGNVEKAAQSQAKDSATTEWWNAKPQSSAPQSLQGAPTGTAPEAPASPSPGATAPATGK